MSDLNNHCIEEDNKHESSSTIPTDSMAASYLKMNSGFSDMLSSISEATRKYKESIKPLYEAMRKLSQNIANIIPSDYFKGLVEVINEVNNNPNSFFNYTKYEHGLDNFHWAWPFEFDATEVKQLVESVKNEKEFDRYMEDYFSIENTERMIRDISHLLPPKHKLLFNQICNSYRNGDYAIANNTIMSILDNLLAEYVENKGNMNRNGILKPMVGIMADGMFTYRNVISFKLMMLSHNIDFVFQDYNFSSEIRIDTNKKARRHPSIHGFKYSNQRVDSLMLMNSLYELLSIKGYLKSFENSLVRDKKNKEFAIKEAKKRKIYRPIIKEAILKIIEESDGMTHKEILEELRIAFFDTDVIEPKFITDILQQMKNKDCSIAIIKANKTMKWIAIPRG